MTDPFTSRRARIDRLFTHPEWMADAPCKGATTNFYGPEGTGGDSKWAREAKTICNTCPHRIRCLEYAIDNNEDFGIWGGHSVRERRQIARNRRQMGWTTGRNRQVRIEGVA